MGDLKVVKQCFVPIETAESKEEGIASCSSLPCHIQGVKLTSNTDV